MNILFLTSRLPYPPIGGDKLRVYHLLKELKKRGNNITLITLCDNESDLKLAQENTEFYSKIIPIMFNKKLAYIKATKALFNNKPFTVEYFYDKQMQKAVDKELVDNNYDMIFCHLIRTAPYANKYKNIKKVIDFTDAISFSYSRRLSLNRSTFDKFRIGIEFKKILNYEIKCLKSFDKSFLIASFDKDFFSNYISVDNIEIIPNGVDFDYFYNTANTTNYDPSSIIFVGNMKTIANCDAAVNFGENIFPLIKKVNENAKFIIAGANPRQSLFEMAEKIKGIEITGKVPDIREYLSTSCVSVCPVRIAAGMQNKVLESMAMGIPVVTTLEGAEGINANEEELLVSNSNEQMAQMILELMNDSAKRNFYSRNSRKFIEENYSWENVGEKLQEIIKI